MNIVEILSKIGFDWRMALANLVNFLIIFWILKKYAFKPIQNKLKERADKINAGLEDTEKAKTELTMAKQKVDQMLKVAREEAQSIVAKAHEQSEAMLEKNKQETEVKAKQIVNEARDLITKEKKQMEADLITKTVDIALQVSEKILHEKLDETKDKELIEKILRN